MTGDRELAHQAAHYYESDDLMDALVDVLKKHCGQEINGMVSIEATPAMVALGRVLCHLIAPFPAQDREDMLAALRQHADDLAALAHAPGGSA